METLQVKHLKPGDKLTVAGIEMEFSYFSNEHPAFYHQQDGAGIVYINKAYTKETYLTEIK